MPFIKSFIICSVSQERLSNTIWDWWRLSCWHLNSRFTMRLPQKSLKHLWAQSCFQQLVSLALCHEETLLSSDHWHIADRVHLEATLKQFKTGFSSVTVSAFIALCLKKPSCFLIGWLEYPGGREWYGRSKFSLVLLVLLWALELKGKKTNSWSFFFLSPEPVSRRLHLDAKREREKGGECFSSTIVSNISGCLALYLPEDHSSNKEPSL